MITVGSVPYLNGKPLVWGLGRERGIRLIYDVPSKLASMLRDGEIAAGMVSSAACFLEPGLRIVPGISISCHGPAQSVKLFHKGDLESVRTVALDTNSLTSVLLAKIILRERYKLTPEFKPMPPSLPDMLNTCDAAVVIGDTAMRAPAGRWAESDLGEEWHILTGLPFVFAVWAVNPRLAVRRLVDVFTRSKALGLRSLREISEVEAARLELPTDVCFQYLSKIMDYDLTDRHMEGLLLFREKAYRNGFIPRYSEIEFYESSAARVSQI